MRKVFKQVAVIVVALGLVFIVGCEEKGPAEKAGETLDKTMDDVKEKVEETTK